MSKIYYLLNTILVYYSFTPYLAYSKDMYLITKSFFYGKDRPPVETKGSVGNTNNGAIKKHNVVTTYPSKYMIKREAETKTEQNIP